jgi:hypothetical protein
MARGLDPLFVHRSVVTPALQFADRSRLIGSKVSGVATSHLFDQHGRLRPRQVALILGVVTALGVVTGAIVPLPYRAQLGLPIAAALIGALLTMRWGDRPSVVLWAAIGMFAGASATQRLGVPLLLMPLSAGGLLIGLLLALPDQSPFGGEIQSNDPAPAGTHFEQDDDLGHP